MREYQVGIFQSLDTIVPVRANSYAEAKNIVFNRLRNGEIDVMDGAKIHIERVEALEDLEGDEY